MHPSKLLRAMVLCIAMFLAGCPTPPPPPSARINVSPLRACVPTTTDVSLTFSWNVTSADEARLEIDDPGGSQIFTTPIQQAGQAPGIGSLSRPVATLDKGTGNYVVRVIAHWADTNNPDTATTSFFLHGPTGWRVKDVEAKPTPSVYNIFRGVFSLSEDELAGQFLDSMRIISPPRRIGNEEERFPLLDFDVFGDRLCGDSGGPACDPAPTRPIATPGVNGQMPGTTSVQGTLRNVSVPDPGIITSVGAHFACL